MDQARDMASLKVVIVADPLRSQRSISMMVHQRQKLVFLSIKLMHL